METTAHSDRSALGSGRLSTHAVLLMKNVPWKHALVLLLCSPAALSQAASYSIIDRSGTCPTVSPSLVAAPRALSLPKIGTTFRVQVPQGFGGSHRGSSVLMTGLQRMSFNMNRVDCGIRNTRVTGCGFLLMVPLAFQPTRDDRVNTVVPNSAVFVGTRFYQQIVYVISGPLSGPGGCSQYFHSLYLGPLALGVVGR